jgi:hypothetical protein
MLRVDGVTIGRGGSCHSGQLLLRDPYDGPFGETVTGRSFVDPPSSNVSCATASIGNCGST